MNLPEAMSHAKRESPSPPNLRVLTWLMVAAVIFGMAATAAAVIAAQTSNNASQIDVQQNVELTRRVGELVAELDRAQAERAADTRRYRQIIQEDHNDQCRIIQEVAEKAGIMVEPCKLHDVHDVVGG